MIYTESRYSVYFIDKNKQNVLIICSTSSTIKLGYDTVSRLVNNSARRHYSSVKVLFVVQY